MPAHVSPVFALAVTALAFLSLIAFLLLAVFARSLWRARPGPSPTCPLDRERLVCLGAAVLGAALLTNAVGLVATRRGLLGNLEAQVCFHGGCFALVYPLIFALVHHLLGGTGRAWKRAFGLSSAHALLVASSAGVLLLAVVSPTTLVGAGWQVVLRHAGIPVEPQPVVEWFLKLRDPRLLAGLVFLAVVAAPVMEEILFRGILHPFLKARFGLPLGLALGSLAFAAFHLHLPSLAPLFVLALGLALLYEWSGNLAACVAMHAGFNALAVAGLLARRFGE